MMKSNVNASLCKRLGIVLGVATVWSLGGVMLQPHGQPTPLTAEEQPPNKQELSLVTANRFHWLLWFYSKEQSISLEYKGPLGAKSSPVPAGISLGPFFQMSIPTSFMNGN